MVAHFYHAYAGGDWRAPVDEHIHALQVSGFDGPVTLGIVGPRSQRGWVRGAFEGRFRVNGTVEVEEGFEQVTLAAVAAYAATNEGVVLYAHTKGAHSPNERQHSWRKLMTNGLILNWRTIADQLLDSTYDVAGPHWLTPRAFPGRVVQPFFAGNFWMARCDYLRTLLPCETQTRWQAELWVGPGNPKALEVLPDYPTADWYAHL